MINGTSFVIGDKLLVFFFILSNSSNKDLGNLSFSSLFSNSITASKLL